MDSDLQAPKSGSRNFALEEPGSRPHEIVSPLGNVPFGHSIAPGVLLIVVSLTTILLFGIGALAFINATQAGQRFQKKLDRIRTGEVKPEILSVAKKHIYHDSDGDDIYRMAFKDGHGNEATDESVSKDFYESRTAGDVVVGYHYPKGYFIPPESLGRVTIRMETMRWIFAGIPVSVSGVMLGLYFLKWRKSARLGFSRG